MENKIEKILIIGANGKIGSVLVRFFSDRAIGCYRKKETGSIQFELLKDKISNGMLEFIILGAFTLKKHLQDVYLIK